MAAGLGSPCRATPARTTWLVALIVTLVHAAIFGYGWSMLSPPTLSEPRVQWVESVIVLPPPGRVPTVPPPATATQDAAKPQPARLPPVSAPPLRSSEPSLLIEQTPVAESARGVPVAAPAIASASPPAASASQAASPPDTRPAWGPTPATALAEVPPLTLPSERAAYLNNPPPVYPPISRRLREQGRVVIRVYIDERGMPIDAQWTQRSGYSRLDQAAMDAVMAWRYVPAKRGEMPVAMWFNVPITFDLKQHKD